MARVELVNIHKAWGSTVAVDRIDLTIEDKEFVAILGPSGCGKSTTLFMLAGVYLPSSGDIFFDGARINDVEARYRNVGIVFQSYALYPNMTALQNIMFPLRFKKSPNAESQAREIAELVQVSDLLARRPSQLSGGQQQRIALARALVKRPNLLLLDEPLSNLDASLRLTMRAEIRRLTQELGVTTILVTHDQLEATTMADRVVCMNTGRVEQTGSAEDLYRRPATVFVAGFIGSPPINLIAGRVNNGCFFTEAQPDRPTAIRLSPISGSVTLGIRPEALAVAAQGIPATVSYIEPLGRETLITVDSALGTLRVLEPGSGSSRQPGQSLALNVLHSDVIVFDSRGGRVADGCLLALDLPSNAADTHA